MSTVKYLRILLTFAFIISSSAQCFLKDFSATAVPLINHYGPPQLLPFYGTVKINPEILPSVAPIQLIIELLNHLNIKADGKSAKEEFDKLIKSKAVNLTAYSIIWLPEESWPKDRIYHLIFHNNVRKWLIDAKTPNFNDQNFSYPVLMGIFGENGVEALPNAKDPNGPVSFNKLELKNVVLHPSGPALKASPTGPWPAHELLYSPKNAHFKLTDNRDIANFWSVAISPDKKNVLVINNLIIDRNDILDQITKALAMDNLTLVTNTIQNLSQNLETSNKKADGSALKTTADIIKKAQPGPKPNLTDIFSQEFINDITKTFGKFPIEMLASNKAKNIYQFAVLSQDDPSGACKIHEIIGNTCGRHSIKNGILLPAAMELNGTDQKYFNEFNNAALGLTTKSGALTFTNENQLTPEASCLFKEINSELQKYRERTRNVPLNTATLDPDEVKFIINHIEEISKKCKFDQFSPAVFTVIPDMNAIQNPATRTTQEAIELLYQVTRAPMPMYGHVFIIGAGRRLGDHWITIFAYQQNKALTFIVADSKNEDRTDYQPVTDLKKLLEGSYDSLIKDVNESIDKTFKDLQEKLNFIGQGKISPAQNINNLLPYQKLNEINNVITQMQDLLSYTVQFRIILDWLIREPKPIPPITFNPQKITDLIINTLQNAGKLPLLQEISNIHEMQKIFNAYLKSSDTREFLSDLKKNPPLTKEAIAVKAEIEKLPDVLRVMVDNGVPMYDVLLNVNKRIRKDVKNTILMMASIRGKSDLVNLLLQYGADPALKIPEDETTKPAGVAKFTALEFTTNKVGPDFQATRSVLLPRLITQEIRQKYPDIVQLMTENKVTMEAMLNNIDMPIREDVKNNILMMASIRGAVDLVKYLLAYGANPSEKIPAGSAHMGKTALDFARSKDTPGNKEVVKILEEAIKKRGK